MRRTEILVEVKGTLWATYPTRYGCNCIEYSRELSLEEDLGLSPLFTTPEEVIKTAKLRVESLNDGRRDVYVTLVIRSRTGLKASKIWRLKGDGSGDVS